MLPNLVETQAAGLMFRVTAARADGGKVIVPVDQDRPVEVSRARRVGRADQGMKRKRRRSIATGQPVDERKDSGVLLRGCHGFLGGGGNGTIDLGAGFCGVFWGSLAAWTRALGLSARG